MSRKPCRILTNISKIKTSKRDNWEYQTKSNIPDVRDDVLNECLVFSDDVNAEAMWAQTFKLRFVMVSQIVQKDESYRRKEG